MFRRFLSKDDARLLISKENFSGRLPLSDKFPEELGKCHRSPIDVRAILCAMLKGLPAGLHLLFWWLLSDGCQPTPQLKDFFPLCGTNVPVKRREKPCPEQPADKNENTPE